MWNSALHGKIRLPAGELARNPWHLARAIYGGSFYFATDRAVEDTRRYAVLEFKGVLPRE